MLLINEMEQRNGDSLASLPLASISDGRVAVKITKEMELFTQPWADSLANDLKVEWAERTIKAAWKLTRPCSVSLTEWFILI